MQIKFFVTLLVVCFCFSKCARNKSKFEIDRIDEIKISSKTMIYNKEQSNSIEGTYIKVISSDSNRIEIDLPKNFLVTPENCTSWHIGWGSDSIYYDAGVENIRSITKIEGNKLILGSLKRGSGFPRMNKNVVFWNFNQTYTKESQKSIIDPSKWKEFAGKSLAFADVVLPHNSNTFKLIFQECDTVKRQAYCAESKDLIHWKRSKKGNPILRYHQFKNIPWASGNYQLKQVPFINDVFFYRNKWYYIFSGLDEQFHNSLGIGYSSEVDGKIILRKEPLFEKGASKSWNEKGNFSGEIIHKYGTFLLAFSGVDYFGKESVGLAFSKDLVHWKLAPHNPIIDLHQGWRSKLESSEVDLVTWNKNQLEFIVSGTKKLRYIPTDTSSTSLNFKYEAGNVDDAQLGRFISNDRGKTFKQHKNNPIIVNDYTDESENEHMGGNIKFIKWNGFMYYFYQAKTSQHELKYSIYVKSNRITK